MNILYVSSIYPPAIGGAQLQLHYLAKAMQEMGEQVQVLTYSANNREDWLRFSTVCSENEGCYEFEGVSVTRIGFPSSTRVRMLPWAAGYYGMIGPACRHIAALIRPHVARWAKGTDVIHLTRIGREFIARACLDYAHDSGIPFILTPNHHPRWRGWRYREYENIYRESDALVVYTEAEKATLVEDIGVDVARIFVTGVGPVVSNNYSVEEFRTKNGLFGPYVLFLGQQYSYKGIEAIIKAAEIVWKVYPEVIFLFVGPHTNFSRNFFKNIHDSRILNLGAVDSQTKAAALAGCEFLCMPSVQESFGGVYIEAWCYRKAVIAGNIPAVACVVDHGVNGFLSNQEPHELSASLQLLLSNPNLCRAMGEVGWRKVQEKYSWQHIASKTMAVYEHLC